MLPGRLAELPVSYFVKLAELLDPVPPGAPPISLTVGDPQGVVPDFVTETLAKHAKDFGFYPPIHGTPDWRNAASAWLTSRFDLAHGSVDPEHHVLPLNGTREGLYLCLFTIVPEKKSGKRPLVLMPNPFYQCYAAAALASGAEPVFVPALAENGYLPDYAALPKDMLDRTAAVYICSPSNPEGAVASDSYWRTLFELADRHDFVVLADECYADIYFDKRPMGALNVRQSMEDGFDKLLSFHSLSKRSGLPGLRSGIVAGDATLIRKFRALRNYAGPTVPMPILAASAAAWRDESHVAANRALFVQRLKLAQSILGHRARFRLPAGGFFLWLDVGDSEQAALALWKRAGVRTLPGVYMGRETHPGDSRSNPGFHYLRIALVSDLSTIKTALERMAEVLDKDFP